MPVGTQVVVVDDGSPDAVVSRLAEGATVLRFSTRQGYCVAANAGLALARGEVVELLNDDTEVCHGWADMALRHFADPTIAAVTPLVLKVDAPHLVDSAGDEYHLLGYARKRGHGQPLASVPQVAGPVFGASGSSSFYRREAFLQVGGFPEQFGAYFEDVDLSFRLRRWGYQILFEPASRVLHEGSASHGRPTGALLRMQSRNEELVWWRNVESWQLVLGLPGHLALVAAKAALRLREGNLWPWLRGRFSAWADLPAVIAHRRGLPLPVAATPSTIPENALAVRGKRCHRSLA